MYLRMFFWRSESFFALTIFPSGAHRAAICMSLEQAFVPNITTFSERVNLLRMPASSVCLCVGVPRRIRSRRSAAVDWVDKRRLDQLDEPRGMIDVNCV